MNVQQFEAQPALALDVRLTLQPYPFLILHMSSGILPPYQSISVQDRHGAAKLPLANTTSTASYWPRCKDWATIRLECQKPGKCLVTQTAGRTRAHGAV